MHIQRLSGTFRELGAALGRSHDWSLVLAEPVDDNGLARECHALAAKLAPSVCDKLDGLCEALGVGWDALAPWYYLRGARIGCTSFAFASPEPMVGRAYHWVHEAAKWCEARLCEPSGRLGFVGYTHNACGVSDGMNERGLCVLISALAQAPARRPGLPWHGIMDEALSTTDTVEEAATLISRLPHIRPFLYFIADADGDMAVVEALPDDVRLRRPKGGTLIATNVAVGAGHPPWHEGRQRAAERALARLGPTPSLEEVRAILRTHDGPFCTGRHSTSEHPMADHEWYTLWAAVVRPRERIFEVAPGRPCETEFVAVAAGGEAWHAPSEL